MTAAVLRALPLPRDVWEQLSVIAAIGGIICWEDPL